MNNDYLEEERYLRAEKRLKNVKGFYWHLFSYIIVNTGFTLFMLNSDLPVKEGMDMGFNGLGVYAIWFLWGIGLLAHWLYVYGVEFIFSKKWENKKTKEFMKNDK